MKYYRANITTTLEGGRPTPTIQLLEDPLGDLVKRTDVAALPTVIETPSAETQVKLNRLAVLEAEHAALLAATKAAA
jgi:hypothetical protein